MICIPSLECGCVNRLVKSNTMKNKIIYQFKDYLIKKYGKPLYRVSIDLALDCPHRDKTGNGCIFCTEDGAKARHLTRHLDLKTQVSEGIKYVERRYNANGNYIAYFQSYTNTNASVDILKKYYEEVLAQADFKMLIISTRSDCLPDDILEYLSELNNRYELWVELGVQSANDDTLKRINRGHDFSSVESAVKKLSALNIKTAAHIILGLPGENINDYRNTIHKLSCLPFSGIKIHNLLVLKKSPLAKVYNDINLHLMNEYEYASALIDIIRRIPSSWPLMRINADAPPENIIAPKWSLSKGQLLELIKNSMQQNGYMQGDLIEGSADDSDKDNDNDNDKDNDKDKDNDNDKDKDSDSKSIASFLKVKTNDDSFTFYHPVFRENFHSLAGAASEAKKKFIEPAMLKEKLQSNNKCINILDIGFGLGYNAIAAVKAVQKYGGKVKIISLELNNTPLTLAKDLYKEGTVEFDIINTLLHNNVWNSNSAGIEIKYGDARNSIRQIIEKIDIVFMDGFSSAKNPELWTFDFIREIVKKISQEGLIVTYSSAFPVRGAFLRNKLNVGTTKPFGRKKGGTIASLNTKNINILLSEKEANIVLKSTAGVSYRDPELNWPAKKILQYRDKLVKHLRNKGVPRWFKE